VSTPGDGRAPDERDLPGPARPYPGPSQYSGPSPYSQAPAGGPADPAAEPPYVYNPYGNFPYPATYPSSPAGLGPEQVLPPPRRPGSLHLALLLAVLSALPYLLVGLLAVVGAGQAAAALPPEDLAQIQELGVDLEQLVRVTGFVLVATALVYLLLGVLAWTGRRWARGLLTALTAGFVLMVATSAVAAGSQGLPMDGASLLVLGVPLVLALLALALMFGSAARDWFARRR
jgi:hypothetical protein